MARFSRTLRRYGCCEREPWSAGEAAVAETLLQVLRARGARELEAARLERGKVKVSDDTWPWPAAGPDIAGELAQESQCDGKFLDDVSVDFLDGTRGDW